MGILSFADDFIEPDIEPWLAGVREAAPWLAKAKGGAFVQVFMESIVPAARPLAITLRPEWTTAWYGPRIVGAGIEAHFTPRARLRNHGYPESMVIEIVTPKKPQPTRIPQFLVDVEAIIGHELIHLEQGRRGAYSFDAVTRLAQRGSDHPSVGHAMRTYALRWAEGVAHAYTASVELWHEGIRRVPFPPPPGVIALSTSLTLYFEPYPQKDHHWRETRFPEAYLRHFIRVVNERLRRRVRKERR